MPILRTPPGGSNRGFSRSASPDAAQSGRSRIIPQLDAGSGGGGGTTPDLILDWTTGSLPSEVTHGGGGNGTVWDSSGALVSASAGRITYDPVSLACRGLLIEEARTNYADHSQELDNADRWWTSGTTVTANDTTGPDGTTTAEKIAGGDYDISHHIYNNSATTGSTAPVFSVFLKASTGTRAFLSISNGWQTFGAALFDIDATPATGVSQAGSSSGSVDAKGTAAYPSNWSRPWIACTLSDGNGKPQFGVADNATTWVENSGYGDCKSGTFLDIYAWQAQIEVGRFPSSPIPNATWSGVTRAADTATITNATYLGAGSIKFLARTAIASPASGTRQVIASGGTAADGWTVYRNSSNEVRLEVVVSSSVVADVLGAVVANDTDVTVGIRLAVNDCNIAVNGTAGTADTSCSLPSISTARFGYDASGAGYHMATLAKAWAWTTPLSDADLAAALGTEGGGGGTGTASIAEDADTVSATATLAIAGSASIAEAGDTVAAAAALAIKATASIAEADDTLAATGSSGSSGTLAVTEADDTVAAAGALAIKATLAATEAADAVAASGALAIQASAAIAEAADTAAATATLAIKGTAAIAEADDTLAATGTLNSTPIAGSLAATEADDTLAATGSRAAPAIGGGGSGSRRKRGRPVIVWKMDDDEDEAPQEIEEAVVEAVVALAEQPAEVTAARVRKRVMAKAEVKQVKREWRDDHAFNAMLARVIAEILEQDEEDAITALLI